MTALRKSAANEAIGRHHGGRRPAAERAPQGDAPACWYDYPQYFDLGFADETQREARFLFGAWRRYGTGRLRRVLECGCGGGRMVLELARRGLRVVACDTNPRAVAYVQARLARRGLRAQVYLASMEAFRPPALVDAALNTFNTFRHLLSEQAALAHLRCVAESLRPGGLFLLGLHVLPPDASWESLERWTAHRGRTQVCCTLRVLAAEPRRRLEFMRATMRVRSPRREIRVATEFPLRTYTARQLRRMLGKVPELELCDVFDFWYELAAPLRLDDTIADTLLVLRKR